jgi:hypothetical protein
MAGNKKHVRKQSVSGARPRSYSQLYKNQEPNTPVIQSPAPQTARPTGVVSSKGSETVDLTNEYGYVFQDLRNLLIVSALLFIAMFAVGFVL